MDQNKPVQSSKFSQVIDALKKQGMNDDQIVQFCQGITEAGYNQIYVEEMSQFTEEDMTAIEACANQEEANKVIAQRFEQRTGQKVEDRLQQYLDVFSDNFLAELSKQPPPSQ